LPACRLFAGAGSVLASVDIFGVWDTRNNVSLVDILTSHNVHHTPVPQGAPKTSGQGGAIGIAIHLSDVAQFCGWHNVLPLGWVQLPACHIGFVYARPSLLVSAQDKLEFVAQLHAAIAEKQQLGPVILMGDFNAEIGKELDASDLHRVTRGSACTMGKMFMDMSRRCDLMTTTGRFDACCASRVLKDSQGHVTECSRIDHTMVQSELWRSIKQFEVEPIPWGSDHHPLRLVLDYHTMCRRAVMTVVAPPPFLRWDHNKQPLYVGNLLAQVELWAQVSVAVQNGDVGLAGVLLTSMIWTAAAQSGMLIDLSKHNHVRKCFVLSLSDAGKEVQRQVKSFLRSGITMPEDLRVEWRRVIREAKHQREVLIHALVTQSLWDRPKMAWQQLKRKAKPPGALFTTTKLYDYYMGMFGKYFGSEAATPVAAGTPRDDMHDMLHAVSVEEVVGLFRRMGTGKAAGVDRLPAEFITKAFTHAHDGSGLHHYHFADVLADMFSVIIRDTVMPDVWKVKCIHPIHKKGDIHDLTNYRPLGVSVTFYMLFAGIMSSRLAPYTAPSHPNPVLAGNQFAFRKELGVEHAHVPIITAIDIAKHMKQPLVLLKLDVEKAYDTVRRDLLWHALREEGIPSGLIQLLQELYREAKYVVLLNGKHSGPFVSTIGLLQGCPLSPILYSLFLKRAITRINGECSLWGVRVGALNICNINFADDITGLILGLAFVAMFLETVERILQEKGQKLSRPKCQALIINPPDTVPTHIAGVPVVPSLKSLGILYDSEGATQLNIAARLAKGRSKVALAYTRTKMAGCTHDVHVNLLLHNMDVRPTLLFGAALWGHHQLHLDPMQHPFQPVFSMLLRQAFGLPAGTAHWIVTLMTGQLPVQQLVVYEFCRFWARLTKLVDYHDVLRACVFVQCTLARSGHDCWLLRWIRALRRVQPAVLDVVGDLALWPMPPAPPFKVVTQAATASMDSCLIDCGDPMSLTQCRHRKIALHFRCMWPGKWGVKPWYLWGDFPDKVWKSWIKFMACTSDVPAQSLVWGADALPYAQRKCRKCSGSSVAHEQHVLLSCSATASVRDTFRARLSWPHPLSLCAFLRANKIFHCAVFVHVALHVYNARPDVP
jgi:Reverse transcriptase (RNA-dependent DNA polymerase)